MKLHKCWKNAHWSGYDDRILACKKCGAMIGYIDIANCDNQKDEFVVMDTDTAKHITEFQQLYNLPKIRVGC